jgi:hypothetical protein
MDESSECLRTGWGDFSELVCERCLPVYLWHSQHILPHEGP